MDKSNNGGRRIRSLQRVSFAYAYSLSLTQRWFRLQVATQQILWSILCMWSDSFIVLRPFWIRLCVRGFKTRASSTSNGRQSPNARHRWQLATARHNPGFLLRLLASQSPRSRPRAASWECVAGSIRKGAASAWTGCALVTCQHRSYRGALKTGSAAAQRQNPEKRPPATAARRRRQCRRGRGCSCHRRSRPPLQRRSLRPPSLQHGFVHVAERFRQLHCQQPSQRAVDYP